MSLSYEDQDPVSKCRTKFFTEERPRPNCWIISNACCSATRAAAVTDYLQRALITAIGLGANRPQDAVHPVLEADAECKPYDGTAVCDAF
jgi:hypothetical protein